MSRRAEKRIADEISEALCKTFVTALEREDIEALSLGLYKIPKTVVFGPLPKTSTGKIQKFVLRQQAKSASAIE